MIYNLEDLQ